MMNGRSILRKEVFEANGYTMIYPEFCIGIVSSVVIAFVSMIILNAALQLQEKIPPYFFVEGLMFSIFFMMGALYTLYLVFFGYVKIQQDALEIKKLPFYSETVHKDDIKLFSTWEKGCSAFIVLNHGQKIKFDEYNTMLISKKLKKWLQKKA